MAGRASGAARRTGTCCERRVEVVGRCFVAGRPKANARAVHEFKPKGISWWLSVIVVDRFRKRS